MSKAMVKRLVNWGRRLWKIIVILAVALAVLIGSIVSWECLTRVPTRRAAPELERARLALSRPVALDPELTRQIASVEVHGADQVTFCGEQVASRPVATIDVDAIPRNGAASAPPNRNVDATLGVPELSLGSERPWTLQVKVAEKNQIELTATSAEPVSFKFYARPRAKLGQQSCDGDNPTQARGAAVRVVIHLRSSVQGDGARWPTSKLFGELWPKSFAGVLKAGTEMTLVLTRFRSCTFDTKNDTYDHFELASTATWPVAERERNALPEGGEIAVRGLGLTATGLVTRLEWDADTTWEDSGACSCRCTEEAKGTLGPVQ